MSTHPRIRGAHDSGATSKVSALFHWSSKHNGSSQQQHSSGTKRNLLHGVKSTGSPTNFITGLFSKRSKVPSRQLSAPDKSGSPASTMSSTTADTVVFTSPYSTIDRHENIFSDATLTRVASPPPPEYHHTLPHYPHNRNDSLSRTPEPSHHAQARSLPEVHQLGQTDLFADFSTSSLFDDKPSKSGSGSSSMSRTKSSGSKSSKGRPLSASSDDTVIGRESPVHGRKPSWKKTGSSSFGSSKSKKASKDYVLPKVFEEKYILVDQVGFGGHGHVFSARRRTDGFEVAVKFMEKSHIHSSSYIVDSDLGLIPTEAYIVKNVRHPSVIGFVDFFEDSRYVILVQELFGTAWSESPAVDHPESDGPQPGVMGTPARPPPLGSFKPTVHRSMDLFDMLEKNFLTENEIRTVFVQVVEAVHALVRKHNIVHGDIKDENVLVDANLNIKLIDFGGAIKVSPTPTLDAATSSQETKTSRSGRARAGSVASITQAISEAFHKNGAPSPTLTTAPAPWNPERRRRSVVSETQSRSCQVRRSLFNGTIALSAPEIQRTVHASTADAPLFYDAEKAEVWTLGILLHTMLFRTYPDSVQNFRNGKLPAKEMRAFRVRLVQEAWRPRAGSNQGTGIWVDFASEVPSSRAPAKVIKRSSSAHEGRRGERSVPSERNGDKIEAGEESAASGRVKVISTPCDAREGSKHSGFVVVRSLDVACVQLLHKMLDPEPSRRPSLDDVLRDLWVRSMLW